MFTQCCQGETYIQCGMLQMVPFATSSKLLVTFGTYCYMTSRQTNPRVCRGIWDVGVDYGCTIKAKSMGRVLVPAGSANLSHGGSIPPRSTCYLAYRETIPHRQPLAAVPCGLAAAHELRFVPTSTQAKHIWIQRRTTWKGFSGLSRWMNC